VRPTAIPEESAVEPARKPGAHTGSSSENITELEPGVSEGIGYERAPTGGREGRGPREGKSEVEGARGGLREAVLEGVATNDRELVGV